MTTATIGIACPNGCVNGSGRPVQHRSMNNCPRESAKTAAGASSAKAAVVPKHNRKQQEAEDATEVRADQNREQFGEASFAGMTGAERVEKMKSEIERGVEALDTQEGWTAWLDQARQFHNYSFGNQLLIALQKPDATRVASKTTWSGFGRFPNVKDSAIWIQRPIIRREKLEDKNGKPILDDQGKQVTREKMVGVTGAMVFDVADTGGDDLVQRPDYGMDTVRSGNKQEVPERLVPAVSNAIEEAGFSIEYQPLSQEGGYVNFDDKKVVIDSDMTPYDQARALAHEYGHIAMGHGDDEFKGKYHGRSGGMRDQMEIEADSVSYMIRRNFGMEGMPESIGYIDGWAKGNQDKVRSTAERVGRVFRDIMKKPGFDPYAVEDKSAADAGRAKYAEAKKKRGTKKSTSRRRSSTQK